MSDSSKVTNDLVDAFLFCPYKPYLLSKGVRGKTSEYTRLTSRFDREFTAQGKRKLGAQSKNTASLRNTLLSLDDLREGRDILFDVSVARGEFLSRIDAVKKAVGKSAAGVFHYEPILLCRKARVNKAQKLSLAYRASVLGEAQDRCPDYGTVLFGMEYKQTRIRIAPFLESLPSIIEAVQSQLSGCTVPTLSLSRRCDECPFMSYCYREVQKTDHLSRLRGITPTEIARHNRNGIFTVTQLSYTFRSRRRPKRSKPVPPPHSYALQALALREGVIYIHGDPHLSTASTSIYFDVEGIPEKNSVYLIGLLVDNNGSEQHQSYWASNPQQERDMFVNFVESMRQHEDYLLFHYGSYDGSVLRHIRSRLPPEYHSAIQQIQERAVNLLPMIYSHVYFPVWSNSLKEIAKYLHFKWTAGEVDGRQSIVWRERWTQTADPIVRKKLVQYNLDDCRALKRVHQFLISATSCEEIENNRAGSVATVVHTTKLQSKAIRTHKWGETDYAVDGLDAVNKRAYFDYQRERVFARTSKAIKAANRRKKQLTASRHRVNKRIELSCTKCLHCGRKGIVKEQPVSRTVTDLKFFSGGVKRWITRYESCSYRCTKCKAAFVSPDMPHHLTKWGDGLMAWTVYQNVICNQNMGTIRRSVQDVFGVDLPNITYRFKATVADRFRVIARKVLSELIHGPILHVDETGVRLFKNGKGYVWVFTSLDGVYFEYRDSREADFLKERLRDFHGVLISDFYTGYDSLDCPQQKCIIHLMRDMNEDLLQNPYDEELKHVFERFGSVLQAIVKTVDERGLKRRYLRRHQRAVKTFLEFVAGQKFRSDIAKKYRKRVGKYGKRLFTFLDYDGVPWNNNNAEHAIKRFAKYRKFSNGRYTEKSIRDYLVLLSVFQTCEYRNIDVLAFLLSGTDEMPG